MATSILLGLALVAISPVTSAPSEADLKAYEDAKGLAQRDPDAHVKLALWCEAHGLGAERMKHLAIAVLADPQHATARGLLGLVAFRGQWKKPEAVAEKVRSDAETARALAEYNEKRAQTRLTASDQWELALWCEQKGLKAEAIAHFATVVRLDPTHEKAWKHLGYKKHSGRWMTEALVAAEKADAEAQVRADRRWLPLLEKWKTALGQKDKRAEAEKQLAAITDPRAVRAIVQAFVPGGAASQLKAVQLLGQIDAPTASHALAILAVGSPSPEVRRAATETLKNRDARDVLELWVNMIRRPFKFEVRPVGGPGSPGALFVEGEKFNIRRLYTPPALPARAVSLYNQLASNVFAPLDRNDTGLWQNVAGPAMANPAAWGQAAGFGWQQTGIVAAATADPLALLRTNREVQLAQIVADYQRSAVSSQQQLERDCAAVQAANGAIQSTNESALLALASVTDQRLGTDREAWAKWLTEERGYAYEPPKQKPKPTFDQVVMPSYTPISAGGHGACFGKGTLVRTLDGTAQIETLRVGDVALAQNTRTGALSFQPIVAIYHNKPNATLKLTLGGETILATPIHRFWKAGKGWVMSRELRVGDHIRSLGGLVTIEKIEPDQVQPVFNLEVAEGQSFFVGAQGLLVHDNSLVRPELQPFDAEANLAAASADNRGKPAPIK
jgi:hypothetical protein